MISNMVSSFLLSEMLLRPAIESPCCTTLVPVTD